MPSPHRSPEEIRALLEGPVATIPVTFTADGALDLPGIRSVVERGITEAGSNAVLLTYGDAHFEMLDRAEIEAVVGTVVTQAAGRAAVIAATGTWSTSHSVDFAHFCREIGADAVQVTYALRWGAYDGNDVAAHHRAIARVIPVQVFGHSTSDVHAALVDEPNVFGYKAESAADVFDITARFGDRYQVMMGGAHWAHQMVWAFGVRSWMSFWCGLRPDIARRYGGAFIAGDLSTALDLVVRFELPFFRLSATFPAGLEATWRASLELMGIAHRYRRPPLLSLTDAEIERLAGELRSIGIL